MSVNAKSFLEHMFNGIWSSRSSLQANLSHFFDSPFRNVWTIAEGRFVVGITACSKELLVAHIMSSGDIDSIWLCHQEQLIYIPKIPETKFIFDNIDSGKVVARPLLYRDQDCDGKMRVFKTMRLVQWKQSLLEFFGPAWTPYISYQGPGCLLRYSPIKIKKTTNTLTTTTSSSGTTANQ